MFRLDAALPSFFLHLHIVLCYNIVLSVYPCSLSLYCYIISSHIDVSQHWWTFVFSGSLPLLFIMFTVVILFCFDLVNKILSFFLSWFILYIFLIFSVHFQCLIAVILCLCCLQLYQAL